MSAKKNWLIGCGVGCALLIAASVVLSVMGMMALSGTVEGFDNAVESRRALEDRFGSTDAFEPWPEGTVPAERMETFLQVRDATQPARVQVSERFTSLFDSVAQAEEIESKGFFEKLRFGLGVAKSGVGMAPDLGTFFDSRNRALLDADMGLGEYTYLYALGYYGLLAHPSDDGPAVALPDELEEESVDINTGMNQATRRIRRDLRTMLKSQLARLPADADPAWRDALSNEIAALERKRSRLPWEDGLPETLRLALEPYRDRLESTYDPVTNPFELARNKKSGKFSFSTD